TLSRREREPRAARAPFPDPRALRAIVRPPMQPVADRPELSVLVPVYNEVESLTQLHQEISAGCNAAVSSYEIVFVDDGSTDGSATALDALADRDPRVLVIHLR